MFFGKMKRGWRRAGISAVLQGMPYNVERRMADYFIDAVRDDIDFFIDQGIPDETIAHGLHELVDMNVSIVTHMEKNGELKQSSDEELVKLIREGMKTRRNELEAKL